MTNQRLLPLVIRCGLLAAVSLGCASKNEAATAAPSDPKPAASAPSEAPAKPAATAGELRCGDFLTTAEAQALGLETKGYDENRTPLRPGMGVHCLIATIFKGDAYDTMISGMHANAEKAGLKLQEGPAIGSASQWTSMSTMHSVMFHSNNKRFAGAVTDTDKALVEKVARALLANMDKK
jgi:hypothetical protein